MLHHLSFGVVDLARSGVFYDAVLSPLGYVRLWTHEPGAGYKEAAVGYGLPGAEDEFAIRLRSEGAIVPGRTRRSPRAVVPLGYLASYLCASEADAKMEDLLLLRENLPALQIDTRRHTNASDIDRHMEPTLG
jgi:hypothetical protein